MKEERIDWINECVSKSKQNNIPDEPIKRNENNRETRCPTCHGTKDSSNRIYTIWDDRWMECYDIFHGKEIPGFNCF